MLAEFANYESWIAWVPIVGVLAIPLALRRVLPLSLALVGSFVGLVWVSIAPPLGRNAEQLGPELALGLGVGAAVGLLIGIVIQTSRTGSQRDASAIVLGWAIVLGTAGALIGGFGPSLIDGPPDLEIGTLFWIAIAGGLGWIAGTVAGWRVAGSAPMPDALQRTLLVVVAIAIAMFGAMIVVSIVGRQFGPSIDTFSRHDRQHLPILAWLWGLDTAVATLTVLVLALRGSRLMAAPIPATLSAADGLEFR